MKLLPKSKQFCMMKLNCGHLTFFTEFGSFTGESGGAIYKILYQKQQNDQKVEHDEAVVYPLPYLILGR
jgi:arginine decarboxylase